MRKKYFATSVGACFSIFCALATYTVVVPVMVIMPLGLTFEILFKSVEGDSKPVYIAIVLALLFTFFTWLFSRTVTQRLKQKKDVTIGLLMGFMILEAFIVHPLGFYLWAAMNWERAGDGQFMFGMMGTFPFSSIVFLPLGLLIDVIRTRFYVQNKI